MAMRGESRAAQAPGRSRIRCCGGLGSARFGINIRLRLRPVALPLGLEERGSQHEPGGEHEQQAGDDDQRPDLRGGAARSDLTKTQEKAWVP